MQFMFAARLHGGPLDGSTMQLVKLVDPLSVMNPAGVHLDTKWPYEALVRYRLVNSSGAVATYEFVA